MSSLDSIFLSCRPSSRLKCEAMAHRPQMGDIVQMALDSDLHLDRKPEVELPEYLDDDTPIVVKHTREVRVASVVINSPH